MTDTASTTRANTSPDRSQVERGRIGFADDRTEWPEDTPTWIRWEQGEPIVEVTLEQGDKVTARVGTSSPLAFDMQVMCLLPDGNPQNAVIVCTLADSRFTTPAKVCGMETGAAGAVERGTMVAAATWEFHRLSDGRALAFQTQGADVLIWSGASVHIRCSTANSAGAPAGAIHLDGRVHLGAKPTAPPMGSSAAPGGAEVPGVAAVPYEPIPYTPPTPTPETTPAPAYVGSADGIVRAKDVYQISTTSDPAFIAWMATINSLAMNPDPAPTAVNVTITGAAGDGSEHTAS